MGGQEISVDSTSDPGLKWSVLFSVLQESINVVPKREWGEQQKLGTMAQQKTHAG